MVCENCGSHNIKEKAIEAHRVIECQVCGYLHGDQDAIQKIKELKEAKDLSIDPVIYPLYKTINSVPTFHIEYSCSGYPHEKVPPYISINVSQGNLKHLEKLAEALVEANKKTKIHWMLEASFQRKLVFILKPNFYHDPYKISAEQITLAQKDLEVLHETIIEFISQG